MLVTILILTGAVVGEAARAPVLGGLAPFLILAAMTWYLIILIADREEIIAALAAILKARRESEQPKPNFWATILTYLTLLGLGIIALWFGVPQQIINRLRTATQGLGIFPGGGNSTTPTFQTNPLIGGILPMATFTDYVIVVAALIFAVSCFILLAGLKLAITTREKAPDDSQDILKMEAAQVVQQTISKLETTKEYHEIILQCYKRMCKALSNAGLNVEPTQTAREFAESDSVKLRVGDEAVRGLTFLFEEARYSNHEILEAKRAEALKRLESLQRALSVNVGVSG